MSGLVLTVTDAGRAALVNAANNGTAPVLMAAVGVSATAVTPTRTATTLPGEIKRITTLSGDAVAADTIHVTIRDESADVYTVRSLALYLADGTLFALYGQAQPIMEKSAQAMLLLAIDVIFADIDAQEIAFGDTSFLLPPATTERRGEVELATEAETETGSDAVRAVTPKGLKAAVTSWLNTRFGEGAPSAFVKSLLTAASAAVLRAALEIKSAALKDEGEGKGLDADLLDGQHASAFAPASHNHAIDNIPGLQAALDAKLAASSYTPADVLAKLLTVDGAGSGLDADLLDGQQGSYYTDIVARLGYTPWGPNNDGAGSGLDADLLDGQHASAFAQLSGAARFLGDVGTAGRFHLTYNGIPNLIGFLTSGASLGAFNIITSTPSVKIFSWFGSNYTEKMALTEGGTLSILGNTVWNAGIDGSGSGLDADMLDGLHASDFAKLADFIASKSAYGYCQLPNGMIIQAGRFSAANDNTVTVTFPVAFPNLCMGVVVSGTSNLSADAQDNNPAVRNGSVTSTQFQVFNAADTTQAFFIAFGY